MFPQQAHSVLMLNELPLPANKATLQGDINELKSYSSASQCELHERTIIIFETINMTKNYPLPFSFSSSSLTFNVVFLLLRLHRQMLSLHLLPFFCLCLFVRRAEVNVFFFLRTSLCKNIISNKT